MLRTRTVVRLVAAALLGLTACSGAGGPEAEGTTAPVPGTVPGGPCPVAPIPVVVSVDQWRDLVQSLGGQCVTLTTVVAGTAADPHDYEPTPGDRAAFEDARLVVVNGLGYDHWAETAASAASPPPPVVAAGAAAGAGIGDNPHQWYDPAAVEEAGAAISAELARLLPDAQAYLDERAAAWRQDLSAWLDLVAAARGRHAGRAYAATESVFAPLAHALGLQDVTPPGYASAAANESDPAPGDLAAFRTALSQRRVDVLVVNTQTAGAVTEQLRAAAEAAGVPVVEVTETVAPGQPSFVAWQIDQLQRLDQALSGTGA